MTIKGFEFGERIKASIATPLVRAGTLGTIGFAYRSVNDAYEVYFDGHTQPQLMQAQDLERADDTHPPDRQRTPDVP